MTYTIHIPHFPGNQAEGISRGEMEEKGEAEGKRGSGVWEEAEEVGDMYCPATV